jgi:CheY-like chemotaxis protein
MSETKKNKRCRVLLVDDHPAVREALALRIGVQRDLEVCGEAADLTEALRMVADTRPDVAVVDISLKASSGIDLIKRIKDRAFASWSGRCTASASTPSVPSAPGRWATSTRTRQRTRSSRPSDR